MDVHGAGAQRSDLKSGDPNGTVRGSCGTPPNTSQLICMPVGGPPPQ